MRWIRLDVAALLSFRRSGFTAPHQSGKHLSVALELDGLGPLRTGGICECCGAEAHGTNGYVFEDPVKHPLACYLATFTPSHQTRSIILSIGLGDWSEYSQPVSRIAASVMARRRDEDVEVLYVDPERGVELGDDLVGRRLTAAEATSSPLKELFLRIAEHVATNDPHLSVYLGGGTPPHPSEADLP